MKNYGVKIKHRGAATFSLREAFFSSLRLEKKGSLWEAAGDYYFDILICHFAF
jgi:hypothetical protein